VALLLANREQQPLRPNGFLSGAHGFAARFYDTVPATPGATAQGVAVDADPRSRCFLCL
jgi:hypothetical protein